MNDKKQELIDFLTKYQNIDHLKEAVLTNVATRENFIIQMSVFIDLAARGQLDSEDQLNCMLFIRELIRTLSIEVNSWRAQEDVRQLKERTAKDWTEEFERLKNEVVVGKARVVRAPAQHDIRIFEAELRNSGKYTSILPGLYPSERCSLGSEGTTTGDGQKEITTSTGTESSF